MIDWINPDDVEDTPRPVVAIANDYPPHHELEWHRHRRGQLLYAARGVVVVSTTNGAWVAPPERAVWTPPGVEHAVKMVGSVSTRGILIDPGGCPGFGEASRVIEVSPLLRHLLVAACELPREYDREGRDGLVIELLLVELSRAPIVPLAAPFPRAPGWPPSAAPSFRPPARTTLSTAGPKTSAWAGAPSPAPSAAKPA